MRRRWRFFLGALGAAAMASPCGAAETPLSAYRAALRSNAAYLAARSGLEAEREAPRIALGRLLPNLSAAGSTYRSDVDRTLAGQKDKFRYGSYNYSLNLNQPVYRPFNVAAYGQSTAQAEAAEAGFVQAGGELSTKVLTAYLDAAFADDVARLLGAQVAAISAQAAAAEKAIVAGSGTRIDLDEARARLDMVRAQEIEVRLRQENALRALQALIGRAPGGLAALQPARMELAPPRPADVAAWIAEAEAGNAELRAARHRIEMAAQEIDKASAGHQPTVDLVASTGKNNNDSLTTLNNFGDTRYTQSNIGLQLNLPLLAGGQVQAAVRQARAKHEQAGHQAEEIRRNLEVQVRREYGNVEQGAAKVRALEQAEASARQTFESSKKGVLAGVRSTLDVLLTDQQLFVVRRDLARERYEYLIAGLRLAILAGREPESFLARLDPWFAGP
jgi:outer membrane protein/protease secretion system outer membrane protein